MRMRRAIDGAGNYRVYVAGASGTPTPPGLRVQAPRSCRDDSGHALSYDASEHAVSLADEHGPAQRADRSPGLGFDCSARDGSQSRPGRSLCLRRHGPPVARSTRRRRVGVRRLGPVAQPETDIAIAVVPLSAHEMIVVESRRKLGYDIGRDVTIPAGWTTTFPSLVTEGVLVYTVDTFLGSGQLPIKLVGDNGNGQIGGYPILAVGESVTVRGYTITVTAGNSTTHTVTIVRATAQDS